MVVKNVARPAYDLLAENGYPDGAPMRDGFDEDDDVQSLPAFVERLDKAWDEVIRLGLGRHAIELQTFGYTVIEPELIGPPEFIQEVLRATIDVARRRRGIDYDVTDGAPELDVYAREADKKMNEAYIVNESDKAILFEAPIYEQVILNEPLLALVSLLIGPSHNLHRLYSLFRRSNTPVLPLHTENDPAPPFRTYPWLVSATWCLTDFNGASDGATCYVPGSHVFRRRPTKHESYTHMAHARSIYAPAGSVLLHNGATWHGAPQRQAEGVRISVNMFYLKGNEPSSDGYRGNEPEGMLERNPTKFAELLGHLVQNGEILTRGEIENGLGLEGNDSTARRAALRERGGL